VHDAPVLDGRRCGKYARVQDTTNGVTLLHMHDISNGPFQRIPRGQASVRPSRPFACARQRTRLISCASQRTRRIAGHPNDRLRTSRRALASCTADLLMLDRYAMHAKHANSARRHGGGTALCRYFLGLLQIQPEAGTTRSDGTTRSAAAMARRDRGHASGHRWKAMPFLHRRKAQALC
jgi:hypothetical protein